MLLVSELLIAALFGSMLFFSFVVAPLIFIHLDVASAGRLIRAVFPWYYVVLTALSGVAAVLLFSIAPVEAGIMLAIASLALFSRQVLMPRINAMKDRAEAGDGEAGQRFDQMHRTSVVINMVQLLGVTTVLILLVRA